MIAVVDYDTGNVGSVLNMLRKIGAEAIVTRDPTSLRNADKLILPGVGAFDEAVGNLRRFGLDELLNELVIDDGRPILGLCLGAQLMAISSEEGTSPGFGWLNAKIIRFQPQDDKGKTLRVPHMGWNTVHAQADAGNIFDNVPQPMRFYFVHSYHMAAADPSLELAHSYYGKKFTCAMGRDNILSMQYHPEKSHKYGLQIFRNFVERFESC